MTIAERIIKIIENKKLTLSQFAEALKVTPAYVSKIKKYPETVPSDRIISDICRIYHVNENWLRTGEGSMFQERTREAEIAEITAALYKSDDNDFLIGIMKEISRLNPMQIHSLKEIVAQLYAEYIKCEIEKEPEIEEPEIEEPEKDL
jgi:transcriptional regulator with XRE-family HTH domain